jgi:hypothetical protein
LFGSVLGFAELAVMFFFFALMLEPCNFVASVMKFGQKPLVEKRRRASAADPPWHGVLLSEH